MMMMMMMIIIIIIILFNSYLLTCRFKPQAPSIKPAQKHKYNKNSLNTQKRNTKQTNQSNMVTGGKRNINEVFAQNPKPHNTCSKCYRLAQNLF